MEARRNLIALMAVSLVVFSATVDASVAPLAKVASKSVDEAIVAAEKLSGRTLTSSGRAAARVALEKAVLLHGDDALKAARSGGMELFSAASKHGDEVWRYASKYPEASRAIAFGADDIMPLVSRIGDDVIKVEVKNRGLSKMVVNNFGDDAVKAFAKMPADDAVKMAGLGGRCADDATKKALVEAYGKTPNKAAFLEYFTPGRIIAGGVTVALIVSAYEISGGVGDGFRGASDRFVKYMTAPFAIGGTLIGIVLAAYLALKVRIPERISAALRSCRARQGTSADNDPNNEDSGWKRPSDADKT